MKQYLSLMLALLLVCHIFAIPAMAEEVQPPAEPLPTQATEAPKPTETTAPAETPKPTESIPQESASATERPEDSTTAPTDATQPKPCTHAFGEWTADEEAHGRKCTLCGYAESNTHSWAAETVTVPPTCKDGGGSAKVCAVCQLILITELLPPLTTHTYDNGCDAQCNVCGLEREVTHTYSTVWTYSYKGHWHKCTVCGTTGELKAHYPGPAATEEKNQICLTCGYIMMKKKEHTHKWNSTWSSDDSGHWYACGTCDEKDSFAAHTYENDCDTDCGDCGYVRTTAHQYDAWFSEENSHWQTCTFCGEESPHVSHEPNTEGSRCRICQYALEAAHSHEYSDWVYDEEKHWRECSCGEKAEDANHIWDEGREEDDMILRTCTICQAERLEEAQKKAVPLILFLAGSGILICLIGIVICLLVMRKKEDCR